MPAGGAAVVGAAVAGTVGVGVGGAVLVGDGLGSIVGVGDAGATVAVGSAVGVSRSTTVDTGDAVCAGVPGAQAVARNVSAMTK